MADRLFDEHVLSIALPHTMSSGSYINENDSQWCVETYFADNGDTAHTIFHMPEANEWYEELKRKGCMELLHMHVSTKKSH